MARLIDEKTRRSGCTAVASTTAEVHARKVFRHAQFCAGVQDALQEDSGTIREPDGIDLTQIRMMRVLSSFEKKKDSKQNLLVRQRHLRRWARYLFRAGSRGASSMQSTEGAANIPASPE